MSGQHVLLFGARGQVGSRLNETLAAAGYEVTALDQERCDFLTAQEKDIEIILRAVEPVLIINASAYTAVDLAETNVDVANRINADMPKLLARIAHAQRIPFVHFSTDYAFDGLRGAPYKEDAPTHPLNVYGTGKLAGEEAVLAEAGHVFRLQWVFDSAGKNFYLTMRRLLAERDQLKVVADQLGAPSNALHIAEAITRAAPLILNGKLPAGLYHLTAGGFTSWHGFTCAIAEAIGAKARIEPIASAEYPQPAMRPRDTRLDTSKLAAYGIAMPPWQEGLAQALQDSHAD